MPSSFSEIVLILIIFAVCLILAFAFGKSRMAAFNLSFYPAILIYLELPRSFLNKFIFFGTEPIQIFLRNFLVFLALFILTLVILNAITGKNLQYTSRKKISHLVALGIAALILVLVLVHQVVIFPGATSHFPQISGIFSSEKLFFWLLAIPILIILLFGRK